MHVKYLASVVVGILLFVGCSEPPYFEEVRELPSQEWKIEEPFTFDFKIEDTEQPFDLLLNFRHGDAYPYSNIHLFMELDFPNGKKSTDTLECILADSRGMWLGRTPGDLVDHRILLNERAIFPLAGDYTVTITQAMRVDPLPDVYDVGFALEKWQAE